MRKYSNRVDLVYCNIIYKKRSFSHLFLKVNIISLIYYINEVNCLCMNFCSFDIIVRTWTWKFFIRFNVWREKEKGRGHDPISNIFLLLYPPVKCLISVANFWTRDGWPLYNVEKRLDKQKNEGKNHCSLILSLSISLSI